jgi:hypothetical protein
MTRTTLLIASIALALCACEEQRNDVSNAVEAAKGMAELAQNLKKAGDDAKKAAQAVEAQAAADIAAGKDPALVKQEAGIAKGLAAAQALSAGGGPAVNWRKLGAFLPDTIGDLKADGELKGETQKAGAFEHSKVSRRYKLGESNVVVSIADGSAMPLLRAPFAMVAMISEDSSEGYKKGTKIDGHTAIVEWREKSKRSEATALIGERFVLHVEQSKAGSPDAAEAIVKKMPLAELAKLTPDEPTEEKK